MHVFFFFLFIDFCFYTYHFYTPRDYLHADRWFAAPSNARLQFYIRLTQFLIDLLIFTVKPKLQK